MKNKVSTYGLAHALVSKFTIKHDGNYGFEMFQDEVKKLYQEAKWDNDAYISPKRIDKVLDKADEIIRLNHKIETMRTVIKNNQYKK